MKHLLMGVAAVALAASGLSAQGNSNGRGNDKAQQAQSGNAGGNRGGGPSMSSAMQEDRGSGNRGNAERGNANRGNGNDDRGAGNAMRSASPGNANGGSDRGQGNSSAAERRPGNAATGNRGNDNSNAANRGDAARAIARNDGDRDSSRDFGRRDGRRLDDGRRIFDTREERRWWAGDEGRGLVDGCPPGLAKKRNGCMPPGLADRDERRGFSNYSPDWWGLSGLGDGRYFYDDGYLLRYSGDRVTGFVPLLAGALAIGNTWPSYYESDPVPPYYENYFGLGPSSNYRYADDVIYRVDPETAAITSIAALLTGDDIRVGQPMPAGYDVYNVPHPYRSRFADGPDARYRYSDGYVYQIDPETRLVAAAIELLAS